MGKDSFLDGCVCGDDKMDEFRGHLSPVHV